ncbi:MAG: hypothetical protein MUE70_02040 [Desulfobacterales bacterium]|jgi:hypothetical protein|nr:hypothetical protein [Desulfobacterales bacterium]
MAEIKYNVVFSGDLVQGQSISEIKARMAALFKTSAESIEALFKQKSSVIKRNVDHETAKKYVQMILKTGAICRIVPAETAPAAPAEKPVAPAPAAKAAAPEKKAEPSGPRVVAIQLMHKGEPAFAPLAVKKISKTSDALNFNKMDIPEAPFSHLTALAAYNEVEDGQEKSKVLLFATVSKRPIACNAENVDYASFSIDGTKSLIASFRNFLYFLCRQNQSIFVEESTFDFLSGSTMQKLDQATILKLSTNMGKLIESGEMAAQT